MTVVNASDIVPARLRRPLAHYRTHHGAGVRVTCRDCKLHRDLPLDAVIVRLEARGVSSERTGIVELAQLVRPPLHTLRGPAVRDSALLGLMDVVAMFRRRHDCPLKHYRRRARLTSTLGETSTGDSTAGTAMGADTEQNSSDTFIARFRRWIAHFGNEFYVALFIGWIAQFAFAFSAHADWRNCLRGFFVLWFSGAAAFFIGTLFGFLFGFPKAGNSNANGQTATYRDNTNLEDVSDWLTKIVVGVSLAEFRDIFAAVDKFAKTMDAAFAQNSGAYPVSVAALVYGFVCGFMAYYTWARSRFRRNLEIEAGRADTSVTETETADAGNVASGEKLEPVL